jgi:hypothetical protein
MRAEKPSFLVSVFDVSCSVLSLAALFFAHQRIAMDETYPRSKIFLLRNICAF